MRTRKRTEITIETARVVLISGRHSSAQAKCERCNKQTEMVPVDVAASLARVSPRTIFRWIEDGELHFVETASGRLLICLDSIPSPVSASFEAQNKRPPH